MEFDLGHMPPTPGDRGFFLSEARPSAASSTPDYLTEFSKIRDAVEHRLSELAPASGSSAPRLRRSIRYSLLNGGKRVRPLATMLTAQALAGDRSSALDVACAIEMVHCASLIIDDLPCMDNAEQRRGKRANHLEHGEDIAILGAITLISEAFGAISRSPTLDAEVKLDLVRALSDAIGFEGLCAGQERDLRDISDASDALALQHLQQQKTGALFILCFEAGARIAGMTREQAEPLRLFGHHAGLAFQILDDLLDTFGDAESTGKDHAQDQGKQTYAAIMSPAEAEDKAQAEITAALSSLVPVGVDPRPFQAFLELLVQAYDQQISSRQFARVGSQLQV
jgi:geranylgeranyl diphosphate synthase type II